MITIINLTLGGLNLVGATGIYIARGLGAGGAEAGGAPAGRPGRATTRGVDSREILELTLATGGKALYIFECSGADRTLIEPP